MASGDDGRHTYSAPCTSGWDLGNALGSAADGSTLKQSQKHAKAVENDVDLAPAAVYQRFGLQIAHLLT